MFLFLLISFSLFIHLHSFSVSNHSFFRYFCLCSFLCFSPSDSLSPSLSPSSSFSIYLSIYLSFYLSLFGNLASDLVFGVSARHIQPFCRPSMSTVCAWNVHAGSECDRVPRVCRRAGLNDIHITFIHQSRCRLDLIKTSSPHIFGKSNASLLFHLLHQDAVGAGSLYCSACLPGRASNLTGIAQCPLCAAGKFNAQPGQLACEACPLRTFSPLTGARSCVTCTAGVRQRLPLPG